MSDAEGLMWAVEKDPALRSDFCNLTLLDRAPTRARVHEAARAAVRAIPRLGQRVVGAPLRMVPPAWVDDPDLDLDYHVRFVGVPEPGGTRELLDLCAALAEAPFDRSRPLWEFTVVEGLDGGRAAMLQKVHHTITDGVGGLRLSLALVDLERDPRPDDSTVAVLRRELAAERAERATGDPITRISPLDVTRDALRDASRRGLDVARTAAADLVGTVRAPATLPARVAEGAALAPSLRRQLLVTDASRSDVMAERSLRRHFEIAAASLPEAQDAARRLGGTVNDVFVTVLTGALGAYHRARGSTVSELRVAIPVSTRVKGETDANRFTPARVLVPIAPDDPVARFRVVRERLAGARTERALHAAEGLAGLAALLPTALLVPIVRNQSRTIDFAASNLRGSPVPLYLAGARILASYPFGPRTGTALNVTLLSYCDELHQGLNVDPAAVTEPGELMAHLDEAWDAVVRARRARRRSGS
jgi:WS/DGAT/MGAT family acyltransferase